MDLSKQKNEKLIFKKCAHEGCETFFSTKCHAKKYCDLHKKRKYTKEKTEDINNKILLHEFKFPTKISLKCELCGNSFEILLRPTSNKIVPKYCEEHRNEYKRSLYLKRFDFQSSKYYI